MKRIHKKNVLDRIDDAINDRIDEIKEKKSNKKAHSSSKEIKEEIEESKIYDVEKDDFIKDFNLKDIDEEESNEDIDEEDFVKETEHDEEADYEKETDYDEEIKVEKDNDEDEDIAFTREDIHSEDKDLNEDDDFVKEVSLDEEEKDEKPKKKGLFSFKHAKKEVELDANEEDTETPIVAEEKPKKKGLFSRHKKEIKEDKIEDDDAFIKDNDLDEETETPVVVKEKPKKKGLFSRHKKETKIEKTDEEDDLIKDIDFEEEIEKERTKKKGLFNFKRKKKDKEDKKLSKKKKKELATASATVVLSKKDKKGKHQEKTAFDDDDLIKEVSLDEEENTKAKKKFLFASNKRNQKEKKIKSEKHVKGKTKSEKPKKRPFWKKIITFILILCILGVLAVAAFLTYIVVTAPEFNEADLVIKDQTLIYDANDNVIAKLGTEKRESITYDKLPQVLIDAIIATEDSRFFQHNGVDLLRFIKATIQQAMGHDDAGGASTLTMQTVKNRITQKGNTNEGKIEKIIRKFQDVYIAVFKVEKEYSKEEILEMYVNDNYLGGSYWGVEEASKYYFGKSASDITLPEAAIIAGLFQLPGKYNPYTNVEAATKRRDLVLKYMYDHEYITAEERDLVKKIPIESLLVGTKNEENKYQGYIDTVVAEVEDLTGDNPYTVPMKIYTAMDKSIQDGINSVYADTDYRIWRDEKVQGGVAVVDVENGTIVAVGAGRNREGERQFNYATMAYRQPGSTAKPIFDYGPGIEYNNFSSYQLFMDEPWTYTNGPAVHNWDGGYNGLITARRALQISRNIPALKAFQQVGAKNSQAFAHSLGLNVSLNTSSENYVDYGNGVDNTINEAYAIGGVAKGFTPLEMATAYACFANGGYYIESHTVNKIIYRQTGEEKEFKYTKERVMKDSTAYIMNNILESAVTNGFNGGALVYGSHVAAKTGTSNYDDATMRAKGLPSWAINDLWTVAYTSKYSIAVWYGYKEIDSSYYNVEDSCKTAFTAAVMKYIPKDPTGWSMPSSVVAATVESETWPAQLPSEYTPDTMKTTEYFVRGTQPTEVSERYQKLNAIKNYNVTNTDSNSATITWEYDTPRVLTKEYLTEYFNKSVFGNSKEAMVNKRIEYNNNTLGEVGFAIYKQDESGSLTLIDYVKDKKYTYTGYGNTTLVIKAEHSKFKSNASDGIKIPLNLDELDPNNIKATLATSSNVHAAVGEYEEKGFKSITYGNLDISNDVTIIYSISGDTNVYTTPTEFETFVNTLPAGTYTITYTITYQGASTKKTKKLTLS